MISDALKILETIQSAQSAGEKEKLESDLLDAIREDIQDFFDDPKYPLRRRSFGAISRKLGIFDDDPQQLKEILFKLGARPSKGEGEDTQWHLPKSATNIQTPKKRKTWASIYSALGALAALLAILAYFGVTPGDILSFVSGGADRDSGPCPRNEMTIEELQTCLQNGGT